MIIARSYYRIMLGRKSVHAKECHDGHFIGGDWGMDFDLSRTLPENWRDFNKMYNPVFLERNPGKSKVAAGLACGMLHTICKGIKIGDFVLCPTGTGTYWAGEVVGDYTYVPGAILPHRRHVRWYPKTIDRSELSQAVVNSAGSIGTVSNISKHGAEIESLLAGHALPTLISTDELVEDPSVFALEKHLEDFLVQNWAQTELGKRFDLVEDEGEVVGQQYPTDTGNIDILAISKDKTEYLVVELKKGRASDAVVGQIQRYMGYVLDDIAEPNQGVRGAIIALEDDLRLRRALRVTSNIEFYRYSVSFKLFKN
jgi:restriction system protein